MNRTSWIIIGITAFVCLVIGILLLWPASSSDWQTLAETRSAKKELAELSLKKEALGNLSKNTDLAKINTTAASYIPEESQSSELILELTAIASQANMAVQQISLENTTPAPAAKEIDTGKTPVTTSSSTPQKPANTDAFTLQIAGGFSDLMKFLTLAESSARLIVIQSVSFSEAGGKMTANVKGEAYWKKASTTDLSLTNITVSTETLQKFANLKQYSTPIDTAAETGFGRTNPFENVQ